MTTILSFLGNLKLTLAQWGLLLVGLVVAGLAIALEITLSKLHASNIKLLEATYGDKVADEDKAVSASRQAFLKALKAYRSGK